MHLFIAIGRRCRIAMCLNNNLPNLASCRFDKHGLVLIIFGKRHQHTFENDAVFNCPCPFTFTYFICFYIAK